MRYGCLSRRSRPWTPRKNAIRKWARLPEEKKPIIDQMTDLAAEAAGTLAAMAVKAAARKARKAAAKRLPRPVKRAANTIAKAAKALASGVGAILRPFGAGIMFK
jgi:hypothetical protein